MEEAKTVVKWSEEAKRFWGNSQKVSVSPNIVCSYSNWSQTGKGLEELINSINSDFIKEKIAHVHIWDTSYLYRHTIPEFSAYSDENIPTKWFLANKEIIEELEVPYTVHSWKEGLDTTQFKLWLKKMKIAFAGDENGEGIISEFRQIVLSEAENAVLGGNGDFRGCVKFILEECAYTCLYFSNKVIVYPTNLSNPISYAVQYFKANVQNLPYNLSNKTQRHRHRSLDRNKINYEIIKFITKVANTVNFFVIDKNGNIIYKNESLKKIVPESDAKDLASNIWGNNIEVMKKEQMIAIEECDKGKCFLSVKAPLIIDDEVEGVIGLAVDITAKKEKEKLKRQQEKSELAQSIAHDVRTPLSILSCIIKEANLPEDNHIMARNSLERIDRILREAITRHDGSVEFKKEQYTCIQMTLKEVVKYSRCKYPNVDFEYIGDENAQDYIFISADYSDFCRAIVNLINNAAEACTDGGKVQVGFVKEGGNVVIFVKDNGVGISPDTIERINSGDEVLEIKKDGHGLGLQQVYKVVAAIHGKLTVQSKKNEGTEFRINAAICENPRWFSNSVSLREGDVVVALDDDSSMLELWKRTFQPFEGRITLKVFEKGLEAVKFINSQENKSKVFLLADYELRNQPLTGVDAIERTNMQERHLLVTSSYVSAIRNFNDKKHFLKIFYKPEGIDKIKFTVS